MFISRKRNAKGHFYHYVFMYDNTSYDRVKTIYSLGRKEKALTELSLWRESNNEIPEKLLELGIKTENIDQWHSKIEGF